MPERNIPSSFKCPISHDIMVNPYIDADGNSYEYDNIVDWLQRNPISPITRNPMNISDLIPNRTLRTLIEENNSRCEAKNEAKAENDAKASRPQLNRKPLLLYALIDVSGSMAIECGSNAQGENDGYNRLDLVKHTLNTIIHSLGDSDRISILKFSTVAEVFCHATALTTSNKQLLTERVKTLREEGQTNIFDALRLAVDLISRSPEAVDFNCQIYLLTDGEPNINPPQGVVETTKDYMKRKIKLPTMPVINTFGYGYNLNSHMLFDLSKISDGIFGFIPDSTMVGTVFINALSHSLLDKEESVNGLRDQVIDKFVSLLRSLTSEDNVMESCDLKVERVNIFLEYLKDIKSELTDSHGDEQALLFVTNLIIDCEETGNKSTGQISKGCGPDAFSKWGMHYMLSVLSAFENRVCINFKDKAMQLFKSEKFSEEQERIEEVFIQLPPPKPSGMKYSQQSYYGNNNNNNYSSQASSTPVDMTGYYNASGGCFSADSLVSAVDSKDGHVFPVRVSDLQRGMLLLSLSPSLQEEVSEVECVVKMNYNGPLYPIGGSSVSISLTAFHPVLVNGESHFPVEMNSEKIDLDMVSDGFVFDLVLVNRGLVKAFVVDSNKGSSLSPVVFAATFGHQCKLDKFSHDYFGSEEVVTDLKKHYKYESTGYIQLHNYQIIRNNKGLACKIAYNQSVLEEM